MADEDVVRARPAPEDEGGDPACWLDRVCPVCGRIWDGERQPRCPACGADLDE